MFLGYGIWAAMVANGIPKICKICAIKALYTSLFTVYECPLIWISSYTNVCPTGQIVWLMLSLIIKDKEKVEILQPSLKFA